jgi:hypothetical protein
MDLTTANNIAGIVAAIATVIGVVIALRSGQRGNDVVRRIIHVYQFEPSSVDEPSSEPMKRADAFELEKRYRKGDFLPVIAFVDQYKQMRLLGWMLMIIGGGGAILLPMPLFIKAIFAGAFVFGVCSIKFAVRRLERRFPR